MDASEVMIEVNGRRMSLAKMLEMPRPAVKHVRVYNCPGLAALPELPAATDVRVDNCPGLRALVVAGRDSRGYEFCALPIRGQWRIIAGCRNYSLAGARRHWGPGGASDRPDCLALVEKLAGLIEQKRAAA